MTASRMDRAMRCKRWALDRDRRLRAQELVAFQDATPALEHIRRLYALGFSQSAITSAAGLTPGALSRLGAYPRMLPRTLRRWLDLTPQVIFERAAPQSTVPAVPSQRRYRALQAIGWGQVAIRDHARALGLPDPHPGAIVTCQRVTARTHRVMAVVFDDLAMTPGPSVRVRASAVRQGYAPPLAWDDGDIDDPTALPHMRASSPATLLDELAIRAVLAGSRTYKCLSTPERHELVRRAVASGHAQAEAARVAGYTPRHVERILAGYQLQQKAAS